MTYNVAHASLLRHMVREQEHYASCTDAACRWCRDRGSYTRAEIDAKLANIARATLDGCQCADATEHMAIS